MKLREGFVIREVGGKSYAVATGESAKYFKGMLTLNEVGVFMFECLKKSVSKDELVDTVLAEYDAERAVVEKDVEEFIAKLKDINVIED